MTWEFYVGLHSEDEIETLFRADNAVFGIGDIGERCNNQQTHVLAWAHTRIKA